MIHIICVAYERVIPLRILIDCFLVQTDPRWMLHIIYDGPPPKEIMDLIESYNALPFNVPVRFTWSPVRQKQYGHPNRKRLLNELLLNEDDFVLMTNDDNYYVPTFVAEMLASVTPNTGVISCNTVHSHFAYTVHESTLVEYGIDMGAFVVSAPVAKAVGFNHMHFSADGVYAKECADYCAKAGLITKHISKPLFIHN